MLLDRTHRTWLLGSSVTFGLLLAAYLICCQVMPGGPSGGSVPGLLFGVTGTSMMVFAALLGARRKGRTWPFRKAQTWMRGHLWLGLLSVPAILFHANLQAGGLLENLLWWILGFVILSGVFGLLMQQILPRTMATSLNDEVSIARQPVSRVMMAVEAESEIARDCGPFNVVVDPQAFEIDARDPVIQALKTSFVEREKGSRWYDDLSGTERDHAVSIMRFVTNEWEPKPAELENIYAGLQGTAPAGKRGAAQPVSSHPTMAQPQGGAGSRTAAPERSPLEQMKQRASQSPHDRQPASPPELLKQQITARTEEAASKPSPLDQMRQKSASAAAASPPTSPRELLKQQRSATRKESSELSPLEQMKQKAAAGSTTNQNRQVRGESGDSAHPNGVNDAQPAIRKPLLEDLKLLIRSCARAAAQGTSKEQTAAEVSLTSLQKQKLQGLYLTRIRPYLLSETGFRPVSLRPADRGENLNDVHLANRLFDSMTAELSTDCEPILDRLRKIVTRCRDLNRQRKMHSWLHAWLAIHIPTTVVLFVLIIAHAVMALRVIPFRFN